MAQNTRSKLSEQLEVITEDSKFQAKLPKIITKPNTNNDIFWSSAKTKAKGKKAYNIFDMTPTKLIK